MPSREEIIQKAIEMGAEFVIQPDGKKSVSSKNYRDAAQAIMKLEISPTEENLKPLSEFQKKEILKNKW